MPRPEGSGRYKYDVFISYSRTDRKWVYDELIPRLDHARIRYCIDSRDFPIGGILVESIERALESSRKVLLVITPHWLESEWARFESRFIKKK